MKVGSQPEIAFVTNTDTATLAFINLQSGVRKVIPCGERPQGQALSPDGKTLYFENSGGDSISVFDVSRQERIGTIETGKAPVRLVVTPDGKTLIYAAQEGRSVGFVDVGTRKEVGTVRLSGPPCFHLLVSRRQPRLFVDSRTGQNLCLSVPQRRMVRTMDVPERHWTRSGCSSVLADGCIGELITSFRHKPVNSSADSASYKRQRTCYEDTEERTLIGIRSKNHRAEKARTKPDHSGDEGASKDATP